MQAQTSQAKNLASGDVVVFPKIGKRKLLRFRAIYSAIGSFAAIFDDNKMRVFENSKNVVVQFAQEVPVRNENELYRFDILTGRFSIISESSFCDGFFEFYRAFGRVESPVMSPLSSVLLYEIRRGATLYTSEAIYSKEVSKCLY